MNDIKSNTPECAHNSVAVDFDEAVAADLTVAEIRKRWPRFSGNCPSCGTLLIKYASTAHYVYGDW